MQPDPAFDDGWDDDALLRAFEDFSLPREVFGAHILHLHVAWLYVTRLPLGAACDTMARNLLAWDIHKGLGDRYHHTVTWAFMLIVHERQLRTKATRFPDFITENADLLQKSPPFLARYYREETLASDEARQHFVLPDRLGD
jgi:hypothetical protein